MARGRSTTVMTARLATGQRRTLRPDQVVVEEPLEIRLDDTTVTVTMRTPGHDYELATGFCFTEGLLHGSQVRTVRYCATGTAVDTEFNVVTVSTDGTAPPPTARLHPTTSACGVCGTASLEHLAARLAPLAGPPAPADLDVLARVEAEARAGQELFESTGAIHAAAAFDLATGAVDVVREDIGRHNAVDKVVGHALLADALPASRSGLWVSGRASFEILQKAWAAGFPLVAAVSGASSLAVETAKLAGITLVGFVRAAGRGASANLYTPEP
ncbi:MAG: formate dehydrogenase accessory sulfurtransferase FdhD [Acidimicrobiales bacterium]